MPCEENVLQVASNRNLGLSFLRSQHLDYISTRPQITSDFKLTTQCRRLSQSYRSLSSSAGISVVILGTKIRLGLGGWRWNSIDVGVFTASPTSNPTFSPPPLTLPAPLQVLHSQSSFHVPTPQTFGHWECSSYEGNENFNTMKDCRNWEESFMTEKISQRISIVIVKVTNKPKSKPNDFLNTHGHVPQR